VGVTAMMRAGGRGVDDVWRRVMYDTWTMTSIQHCRMACSAAAAAAAAAACAPPNKHCTDANDPLKMFINSDQHTSL